MKAQQVSVLARRIPTIAIALVMFVAEFTVLFGDVEESMIYTLASIDAVGVAVDGAGNVYVADYRNHRIRRIDPQGVITTFAGTGKRGYAGDGGPATAAQLSYPWGVAVDGAGNVYVADYGNHRIRRIDPQGVITTFAGTGKRGYAGDGGPATEARFLGPCGLAVDGAGNVYVADRGNHRIRRIDTQGVITAIHWTRECGVAVDGAGNVFMTDSANNQIWRIDPEGVSTIFAGTAGNIGYSGDGGPATEARFHGPCGVAVDGAGNVYVADCGNYRIRRIDTQGVITTVAGTGERSNGGDGGPATDASLGWIGGGIAVDGAGNIYVADDVADDDRVRVILTAGAKSPYSQEFPHFANGDSTVSDVVLVNVDTKTVTPIVHFYGSNGERISADSVVDVAGDLELAVDGSLSVKGGNPAIGGADDLHAWSGSVDDRIGKSGLQRGPRRISALPKPGRRSRGSGRRRTGQRFHLPGSPQERGNQYRGGAPEPGVRSNDGHLPLDAGRRGAKQRRGGTGR